MAVFFQRTLTPAEAARAFIPPDVSDPPFLAPIECVMDLPFPPSANKLWTARGGGHGQLMRSKQYMAWRTQAGVSAVANGSWRRRVTMPGNFTALILLDSARRPGSDCDNRIKPVLDWAQSVELIRNDELCDEVTARWAPTAEAPRGCRLILRSVA